MPPSNVVHLPRNQRRSENSSTRDDLLNQLHIEKPLEASDEDSVLTIEPGENGAHVAVDTYVTVPRDADGYDGVLVKLTQTDPSSASLVGDGIGTQLTAPPRTMAGAFDYWVERNGAVELAGIKYDRSDVDRKTGEVVLSKKDHITEDGKPVEVLTQRRLRPSAGDSVIQTAMPPKVALINLKGYQPSPGLLAASADAPLTAGATFHVIGESIESLEASVASSVRPKNGGWTDPKGVDVIFETWLNVKNTDRAPISHQKVVLRSGEVANRWGRNQGPTTVHTTELADANLKVTPGRTQKIRAEKQDGKAHVEYQLSDQLSRPAGEAEQESAPGVQRFVVLDNTFGERHAGGLKFFDGINVLGTASVEAATPGRSSTTSDGRSSGVSAYAKTTWSAPRAGADAQHNAQSLTAEYQVSNISRVAGQAKLEISLDGFSSLDSLKINGQPLQNRRLSAQGLKARVQGNGDGAWTLSISLDMPQGTDANPAKSRVAIEVAGQFELPLPQ